MFEILRVERRNSTPYFVLSLERKNQKESSLGVETEPTAIAFVIRHRINAPQWTKNIMIYVFILSFLIVAVQIFMLYRVHDRPL